MQKSSFFFKDKDDEAERVLSLVKTSFGFILATVVLTMLFGRNDR